MHHAAWILAPLLLVVVLAWSGTAKIGHGASLRSIIASLGLPSWVLPDGLARSVPWIEIALAVALLSPWLPLYAVAAAVTLALMCVYWLLIARGLTITPRPSCGCFGDVGDHRISGRTLARNTVLVGVGVAAVALAWSGRTVWSVLSDFTSGDRLWLALSVVVAGCVALILGGSASPGAGARGAGAVGAGAVSRASDVDTPGEVSELDDLDDLGNDYVRTLIPTAVVVDAGSPVTLHELAAARAQLLVFIDCYCPESMATAREVPAWVMRTPAIDVRLVCSMPHDAGTPIGGVANPLLDHARLTWEALDLDHSPSAVLLGADGFLAGGPVQGLDEIREFVADIQAQLTEAGVTTHP